MSLAIMAVLYPIIFIGELPGKTMAASLRKQAGSPAAPCQLSVSPHFLHMSAAGTAQPGRVLTVSSGVRMMRRKMMALAAIPVAALLAGGGVAAAQAVSAPAGPAATQQAAVQHQYGPGPGNGAGQPAWAKHAQVRDGTGYGDQDRIRDRDRDGTCDHVPAAQR
ncbi:MAG: hypothetical protein ACM32E_22680 [Gemmatimonadota bacterium]